MMFFTAAEPSVNTVFYLRPAYPQCAGKAALPTCPSQRFCERDNTPAGLFSPSLLLVATTISLRSIISPRQGLLNCFLWGISPFYEHHSHRRHATERSDHRP